MGLSTVAMVTHKFSLCQELVFTPGTDFAIRVPARCKVTRLLPKEGAEYQYHIQTEPDGQQRRALESQLRPVIEGNRLVGG